MEQHTAIDATIKPTSGACGDQNSMKWLEHVDIWQPGTCSIEAMRAYKALEAEGVIQIQHVEIGRHTERVRVRYMADKPHDQVLGLLKQVKEQMTNGEVRTGGV